MKLAGWRRARPSRRQVFSVLGGLGLPPLALLLTAAATPLPPELDDPTRYEPSVEYVDRDGARLREVRASDAARARWVPLEEVGFNVARALVAAEDRRFYEHPGVDPLAVVRAAGADLWHRRVVSGASTLTMQLARLLRPHPHTFLGKFEEAALALRIEASLSKGQILAEYANRAPFGASLRGIDAASRYYFDKAPTGLTLAEAATLASIPRGPAVYSLERHPERVLRRRDRILQRLRDAGTVEAAAYDQARAEPLVARGPRRAGSFGAPHLVSALDLGLLDPTLGPFHDRARRVVTTVARGLQRETEDAASVTLRPLASRHVSAASVVVVDNQTGEVLAYVGSADFHDAKALGQNDGARALRQPGSALKPFVYGLALDQGRLTAASALPDVQLDLEVSTGVYAPRNYDERYHGPVRLREALANSLNVPAVWAANEVGIPEVLARLHDAGFASLAESADHYGPAVALGDGEVTLLELTNAYATLARGGVWRPLRFVSRAEGRSGAPLALVSAGEGAVERRVFTAATAALLTDVLADARARLSSFGANTQLELPFPVAAKTGTSKGYRDNWTVGYTREVTVGVWVGNFDGTPMEGVSGIAGAAPLFRVVMAAAMRGREPQPLVPDLATLGFTKTEVCPLSGGAKTKACPHAVDEWLPSAAGKPLPCAFHEQVRIDRRNGLLAGPTCPAALVEIRSVERFEGAFAAWAEKARREMAPVAWSPSCPAPATGRGADAPASSGGAPRAGLAFGYPREGARFVLDPERAAGDQAVSLRVLAPTGTREVAIRVDGAKVAEVRAPFVARWVLTPGSHTLVAETEGERSAPLRVSVE